MFAFLFIECILQRIRSALLQVHDIVCDRKSELESFDEEEGRYYCVRIWWLPGLSLFEINGGRVEMDLDSFRKRLILGGMFYECICVSFLD